MKNIGLFLTKHATLITIILMSITVLAIIIAGGAPDCFNP